MSELQEIVDAIVVVQAAITPPAGEKDVVAYDEWPAAITVFPSFVNDEVETTIERPPSMRIETHLIRMYLLFGGADVKYSQRTRRKWVEKVQDAFEGNVNLAGTCTQAVVTRIDYGVIEAVSGFYAGATFELQVEIKQGVAYA
jgi:hypothetical protein